MTENNTIEVAAPPTRLVHRFLRQKDGATAVEFAFVAVPFFAMIFAIIEISLIFFGTQMLENQVADSARLILTGQQQRTDDQKVTVGGVERAKTTDEKLASFKKTVCDKSASPRAILSFMFDCDRIKVDVRSVKPTDSTAFSRDSMNSPLTNGRIDTFAPQYNPGDAGDIVVVRVVYDWDTMLIQLPIMALQSIVINFSSGISDTSNNPNSKKRLLMASAVFKNEPFK